jgi:PAS domain S-box-containing protein
LTNANLTPERFLRLFRRLILATWIVPAFFGMGFLLFIRMFTLEEFFLIQTRPLEPLFVLAFVLGSYLYFRRFARPILAYLERPEASRLTPALDRMRRFPLHYWVLFLAYLVSAPTVVITAAQIYSDFVPQPLDWFRIHLVALIVSIIVGLPIFFMTLDLFGQALGSVKLERPHVTIGTKVFLIGALVPLLIDTMLVQYYWTRTGYFTTETFSVWLVLELLAIAGSLVFVRSFGQSLRPLAGVLDSGQTSGKIDISGLVPQSTDELGVLSAGYSEILHELRVRNDLLELRNRVLRENGVGATLNRTINTVLAVSQQVVAGDVVVVLLHDRKAAALVAVAQTGRGYREEGHFRIPLAELPHVGADRVFRQGEPLGVDDVVGDSRVSAILSTQLGARSMLANPLVINSEAIGVLVTVSKTAERPYAARDRILLEGLAQEAALAIHTQSLERQRAERDAHIRLLLDSTAEAIYGVDLEGRCTFVNRACVTMLGYGDESELLGRYVHELVHRPPGECATDHEHDHAGHWAAPRPESRHGDDHVHWRADGTSFPAEYWTHPIYRDGEITGTVAAFVDISERRQAEEALLRSEERYALAQRAANIGSWELTVADRGVFLSDTGTSMFGLVPKQFGGTFEAILARLHPDDREMLAAAVEAVIRGEGDLGLRCRIVRPDGDVRWFAASGRLFGLDSGGETRLLGVIQDITDRVTTEQELEQHRNRLEELVAERTRALTAVNKELEAFSYSVSHDLRAPLRAIDGFSQALVEDFGAQLDGEGQEYLRRVRTAAQRMGLLIDDLLSLSRLTRRELREDHVDLSAIAQEVVGELQRAAPHRKAIVEIAPGLHARGDAGLLRAMLQNLLGNAWKFTAKTELARIALGRADGERSGVGTFFVRDNGAGFDMRHADKLFGAFQRLHRADEFEGSGIGLATVKRILQRHGGRVWAEGEPDNGACFYFELPDGRGAARNHGALAT